RGRGRERGPGWPDRGTGRSPPTVRLPTDLGAAGSRGLVGQQESRAADLATVGAEAGQAEGQPEAPPAARAGRECLSPPAVAWQGRCMDMGLYLRPYQRRPEPEVAEPCR